MDDIIAGAEFTSSTYTEKMGDEYTPVQHDGRKLPSCPSSGGGVNTG